LTDRRTLLGTLAALGAGACGMAGAGRAGTAAGFRPARQERTDVTSLLHPPPGLQPPVAARKPHPVSRHGATWDDPYAWLRDPAYPEVRDPAILAYLKDENAYAQAVMAPHQALVDRLFAEFKGRIRDDDASVPARDGAYDYWWKFAPGAEYRTWIRRPVAGGADSVLIDETREAAGKDYFQLGALEVSPDDRLALWSSDQNGSERYTARVRDLATGRDLADAIENTLGQLVWSADSLGFFYTLVNENWRPYIVKYHRIGEDPAHDRVVYEEADPGFFLGLSLSQSRRLVFIEAGDQVTGEVRFVPAAAPATAPVLVRARQKDVQYDADEREGTLFIRVNDTHPNFRIVTAPVSDPGRWSELIAGTDRHYLRGLTAFRHVLAISERIDGLDQVRLRGDDGSEHHIAFPESSYVAGIGDNPEYDIRQLRLGYESMVTPQTVYDYDLATRTLVTRKVRDIPSGYDASRYVTERLQARARDGTLVPVSIVYRRDFVRDGTRPVHLYGYGAYGYAVPPGFSILRLSLLDRGFAFAIAHIRGGDDLGRRWYLDGKLDKRANTFNDFVDVARHLVSAGYAAPGGISASGGSAGGWLMGAVVNQDPTLWRAIVAQVPFVDVLNTMLDETLPLTPPEWPEWGNPITDATAFARIRSLSPYDTVEAKAYPPMLIAGGLNDPRVTYWEPAKWAAKLRHSKTGSNVLLLRTNMEAGHGGKSGRFDSLHEDALDYAFLLLAFGIGV